MPHLFPLEGVGLIFWCVDVLRKFTVGSCFSGIGGLELGLEWTGGFETKWQIEIDPYASQVLKKHWPTVKRYTDIRAIHTDQLERVDVICGGYPCQPFSFAGKRGGETDARHLWPYMHRIIRELRPRFALLENVPGHLSMGFGRVLGDLAECGYDAEWQVLSAAGAGAPHLRRRICVVAYSQSSGQRQGNPHTGRTRERAGAARERSGSPNSNWWETEPDVGRVVNGLPTWIHGGFNAHESCVEEARTKGIPQNSAVRDLWWFYKSPEAPPRPSVCAICTFPMSVVPREGRHLGWDVGTWTEEKEGVRQLRKGVLGVYARSRSALRGRVSFTSWTHECSQTMEHKKHRLRCLGNAVVPQVAQAVGEMILAIAS